jgi:serine/threonine protein kinase/tetratricopeptide (TPR) repeat protein
LWRPALANARHRRSEIHAPSWKSLYTLSKETRQVQPGTRLGPYEVVAQIGAGGMGEVYCARDTRLGREVAIKLLPAEFSDDPERLRRFEQEARAVAALSNPHILALFDVGTHEGSPYLVTELLEGESLRERLQAGPLTPRKATEVGAEIAQGLAAAHEKGIVHRDLKPANVFITKDGYVKILDFGIAKLVASRNLGEPAQATTVVEATAGGTTLGTVGYMSPEQVRGQSVDHRTDIFSFGCVLYEMLSGERAFSRDTAADTTSAILHEDPPPLAGMGREIPPAIEGIVTRCLEKSREDRFQSARDLAHDLSATTPDTSPARPASVVASTRQRRLVGPALAGLAVLATVGVLVLKLKPEGPSARAPGPPKIVVLPFENLGAPSDAYFASGMAEEITSRLANVHGLGVISRTSAGEYNRRGKTVKQIGKDLGVEFLLEGSVRWEHGAGRESRVRITPQLIRVADDTHVWADRYDRVIADVFAIQSEVAESVVKAMGVALLPHEQAALKEISTSDLEAYNLYLRGLELSRLSQDRTDLEASLRLYEAAIDRDPRFARALAGLSRMHLLMYFFYYDRGSQRILKARETAERAVELRPDLAETHIAFGWYLYMGLLDYPRALDEFAAALRIQPKNSDALFGIGTMLRRQGRWTEAAQETSRAAELDPRNAVLIDGLGDTYVYDRRYADADRAYGDAIALNPQWAGFRVDRARLQLRWHGDVGKAQAILDEARAVAGLSDEGRYLEFCALEIALARRDFPSALRQLEGELPHNFADQLQYVPFTLLRGQVEALAGQPDQARRAFGAARLELEQKISEEPEDPRFHSSLGIAYAGLGFPREAVREARLACELPPASKDALKALWRVKDLALVYTMTGQAKEAIGQLDDLLGRSGEMTPHILRLDPRWSPLRSDPRFQALLAKYEVKD